MSGPPLALVPLDDRPCNRQFPAQLAAIAGRSVLLPPRDLLGWFTQPGECEAVAAWLAECPAEGLVVSLDMLCFGGLVSSRTPAVSESDAMARLEVRAGSLLDGCTIAEVEQDLTLDVVLHISGDRASVHPDTGVRVRHGDELVIFARDEQLQAIAARNRASTAR